MRRSSPLRLFISLFFCINALLHANEVMFQVLEPLDKSIHTQDLISCVIRVDPSSVDAIKISTDRNERFTLPVTRDRDTYCQRVPVYPGKNKIRVRVYANGKKMAEDFVELYYSAPLSKTNKFPPKEFVRKFFHNKIDEDELCSRCHDLSVNEEEGVAFLDVNESNCYACHKSITQKQQTHAPAVNWMCSSCHNGKAGQFNSDEQGKSRFLAPDPIGPVCLDCHKKTKKEWESKKYRHDPVAEGRCTRCHDPHASQIRFTLRKPLWDLCRTCHGAKAQQHTFENEISKQKDHPLNPANSGRELTCSSCHNPHVSDTGFFLQPDYPGDMQLCRELNSR